MKISHDDAFKLIDLGDVLIEFPDICPADVRLQLRNLGYEDAHLMALAHDLGFLVWDTKTNSVIFGEGVREQLEIEGSESHYFDTAQRLGWIE